MNPLRQRMIDDLRIRNYSQQTINSYVRSVAAFAAHFGRSPAELGAEHIRAYQVFLVNERKVTTSSLHRAAAALRFLYKVTLHDKVPVERIPYPRREKKLVLSRHSAVRGLSAGLWLSDSLVVAERLVEVEIEHR